jgi:CRP-like cAMP-binding protein
MLSALIQKLEALELISGQAQTHLRDLPVRQMQFLPRQDLVREFESRENIHIVVEGVAGRYKALDNDRNAILGLLLPGDIDETDPFADHLDHSIAAIIPCTVAQVSRSLFDKMLLDNPDAARGFRRMARLEQSISRMWLANMGRRAADRQAAHLLCELRTRFSAVGLGGTDWFSNPFTQEHLAGVLGISTVHMNRVLQHLREKELIHTDGHVLRFPSSKAIEEYAAFDNSYLRGELHTPPIPAEVG